jgi:peptide chain release factor 1
MFTKLDTVERRFEEIEAALSQDGLETRDLTRLSKERAMIEDVVVAWRGYKALEKRRDEARLILDDNDPELRSMAREELDDVNDQIEKAERELTLLMLPKDPNDQKNVMLEIRAGTGGEEAALFAGDLLRMYQRYASKAGWRTEILSSTTAERGGIKEVIVMVEGDRVYSRLKFESGVHRVQRVPETEAQGRIHTSACTVAVLPEADEVEVNIRPQDLDITVCRSSGAGGQHVNTSDSAVRMVHIPTGIVVECQDERSQLKNKEKALKILKARIFEKAQADQNAEISAARKSLVGSGDRSERIRTYNFPQGRLTDHRINYTVYNLPDVINGDLDDVLDKLGTHHQAEMLKEQLDKSM